MHAAHVVCRECGARWTAIHQPRECRTPGCEAGWLDLPQFMEKEDADRAAEVFASERVAVMREP
jgi:hypothetical protein